MTKMRSRSIYLCMIYGPPFLNGGKVFHQAIRPSIDPQSDIVIFSKKESLLRERRLRREMERAQKATNVAGLLWKTSWGLRMTMRTVQLQTQEIRKAKGTMLSGRRCPASFAEHLKQSKGASDQAAKAKGVS